MEVRESHSREYGMRGMASGGVWDLELLPSSLAVLHPPTAILSPQGPLETILLPFFLVSNNLLSNVSGVLLMVTARRINDQP